MSRSVTSPALRTLAKKEYVYLDGTFSQDVTEGQATAGDAGAGRRTVAAIIALQVMGLRKQGGWYEHFD